MIINSKKEKRNVLHSMLVALWVSHFERSLLNLKAFENTIKKEIFKRRRTVKNKKWKKIQVKCLINVWTTRTEKKEREGRTAFHVDDTFRIPFWEITVERKGMWKHYQKRNIQKKKYDNDKKWKKKDSC